MHVNRSRLRLLAVLLIAAPAAYPQWAVQTVDLHEGWNAIHIWVQPEPNDTQSVFAPWLDAGHIESI